MNSSYWFKVWEDNDIGFHLPVVNPALEKFGESLLQNHNGHVFVPLCGKSLDMLWLSKRAEQVYGVELSEKAVLEFFEKNNLKFTLQESETFKVFKSGNITIYCGDVFEFPLNEFEIDFIFDRGSLVAFPLEMREKYYKKFSNELLKKSTWLLCVFDYSQEKMKGPPFSINKDEIDKNLGKIFQVDILDENVFDGFAIEGVKENIYLLKN